MLSGDNGILQKATQSKEKTTVAGEKEQIQLEVLGSHENDGTLLVETVNTNVKSHINGVITDDATEFPLTVTYTATGNKYEVYGDGKVDVKGPSITEFVKVGDYIDYDPTLGVIDTSKLTYTSPTGTGQSHGNGYTSTETGGGQKYTAKSTTESGIKWQVLSVTNDKIEIISTESIKKDSTDQNNGSFVLKGAIGYLYAEQELNEICKIYGYGKGADTSQTITYVIGGPASGEQMLESISGSGARSITAEDINKIAKVGETADGTNFTRSLTDLNSSYGITTNPTSNVYYPTISTSNGKSSSAGVKNLKYTRYIYDMATLYSINTNIRDMLFNDSYWLATRCVYTASDRANYFICDANTGGISGNNSCNGSTSSLSEFSCEGMLVRPLVTLKSNIIDITNATDDSGIDASHAWKLK